MTARLSPARLTDAFDTGARTYDTLVGRNPGYHEHLRTSARRLAGAVGDGTRILDLGCGTGASTAALLTALPAAEIVAVDASAGMLAEARAKAWPAGVRFVHATAEGLADAGVSGPFDAVFAAYLVRNLADPDAVLRDLRTRLRPGGVLAVHDYVAGSTPRARVTWHVVCWGIVVPLAVATRSGIGLYRHLWRSVRDFDTADRFTRRLAGAGYTDVTAQTMPGWQQGIEHTFLARTP